jgi:hypothetical protein
VADAEEITEPQRALRGETGWDHLMHTSAVPSASAGTADRWPDLTGLTLRAALEVVRAQGGEAKISGSGIVTAQYPGADSPIGKGRKCRLTLR